MLYSMNIKRLEIKSQMYEEYKKKHLNTEINETQGLLKLEKGKKKFQFSTQIH